MNVYSLLFDDSSDRYRRFANVLSRSMAEHSPATPLTIHRVNGNDDECRNMRPGAINNWVSNTRKGKHWRELVCSADEGELIGLVDLDMMALGDLSPLEAMPFDFAYTVRPTRYPFNTGAVFVRVSDRTRQWFRDWYEKIELVMRTPKLFRAGIDKYAGVHQAGLAAMLATSHSLKIEQLQCRHWNCTVTELGQFDADTKLVHVLGNLRAACLGTQLGTTMVMRDLAERFHAYERQ